MKNLLNALILLFSIGLSAQPCGTNFSPDRVKAMNQWHLDKNKDLEMLRKTPSAQVPITVWSNFARHNMSPSDIQQAIDDDNDLLRPFDIEMVMWENEIRNIDDASYIPSSGTLNGLVNQISVSGAFVEGTLNIYFIGTIDNKGTSGLMIQPNRDGIEIANERDLILIDGNQYTTSRLAHELGHYLGLYHTWGPLPEGVEYAAGQNSITNELVNGTNSINAGDMIADTPADPANSYFRTDCNYSCNPHASNAPCHYENQNIFGARYAPDRNNIMTYNFGTCRNNLSSLQAATMRSFANSIRHLSFPSNQCTRDPQEPCHPFSPSYVLHSYQNDYNRSVTAKFDNQWDIDAYALRVSQNKAIEVTVDHGNTPCYVSLYDVVNNEVVGKTLSSGTTTYETPLLSPGIYFIQISPLQSLSQCDRDYTINISTNVSSQTCTDIHEENDTQANASFMSELVNQDQYYWKTAYIGSPSDVDYYSYRMMVPGRYRISLSNLPADYDFEFINRNGDVFRTHRQSGTLSETRVINKTSTTPSYGYIKVSSKTGAYSCQQLYRIQVQLIEVYTTACPPDNLEPDNSSFQITAPIISCTSSTGQWNFERTIHEAGDQDFYRIHITQKGTININLTSLPKDYDLRLYDSNRNLVDRSQRFNTSNEFIQLQNNFAGVHDYYLEVDGYGNANSCNTYLLGLNWTPENTGGSNCTDNLHEPNDIIYTASTSIGTLGTSGQQNVELAKIKDAGDLDIYKVTFRNRGNFRINCISDFYPVRLELSENGYNTINVRNSTGTGGYDPLLYNNLTANNSIYIRVFSPKQNDPDFCHETYTLPWQWAPYIDGCNDQKFEPNENFQDADITKFDNVYNGPATAYAYIGSSQDKDYYRIRTNGNGQLNLSLSSLPKDYDLELYNSQGNLVKAKRTYGNSDEHIIQSVSASGDQYFYAYVFPKTGDYHCTNSYRLSVSWDPIAGCTDVDNDRISTATTLNFAGIDPFNRTLLDHKISRPFDLDYFKLSGNSAGYYFISLGQVDIPVGFSIVDAQGNLLGQSQASGNNQIAYYTKRTPYETIYIRARSNSSVYDCSDEYSLSVFWRPSLNTTTGGGVAPTLCDYVLDEQNGSRIDYHGNTGGGSSIISNNYCESGLTGNELIFSYHYNPAYSEWLNVGMWDIDDPSINFYLLDDCDPNIAYCYGKGEIWDDIRYASFFNLEKDRTYYILVDGLNLNSNINLEANEQYIIVFIDPVTGCGLGSPDIAYQCQGGRYNVILDYPSENISDMRANGYIIDHLGGNKYRVNNVASHSFEVEVDYTSAQGFSCTDTKEIGVYDCNVSIFNCAGLDPPAIPGDVLSCHGENPGSIELFNPNNYEVTWYQDAEGSTLIQEGDIYSPTEFGTYFIEFEDYNAGCKSDLIPVTFVELDNISYGSIIHDLSCAGLDNGKIELVFDNNPEDYEIYWNDEEGGPVIENLSDGIYTVKIYNSEQCEKTETFTIKSPDPLRWSDGLGNEVSHLVCPDDGLLFLSADFIGGSPPLNYRWSNGHNDLIYSDPPAGSHILTMEDANGCFISRTFNVSYVDTPDLGLLGEVNEDSFQLTAIVPLNISSIEWSTGSIEPYILINTPGTYNYIVTDFLGCTHEFDGISIVDRDNDGYIDPLDCNVTNPDINPGQTEMPYNGFDDDCDESTPDDDIDGDGFPLAEDCDDGNADINPNATEIPYNGIDEDCNIETPDDDLDGDGFPLAEDCDDENAAINPDAEEIPDNDIDENCDGNIVVANNNVQIANQIVLYPNPANTRVFIKGKSHGLSVLLFDSRGQFVLESQESEINISTLKVGLYIVKIGQHHKKLIVF